MSVDLRVSANQHLLKCVRTDIAILVFHTFQGHFGKDCIWIQEDMGTAAKFRHPCEPEDGQEGPEEE